MSALALPLPYPLTAPEALRRGLTFYAPLTPDVGARPVRLRGIAGPSAESVGAVGTYVSKFDGLVHAAQANVLRVERKGALLEGPRTNSCLWSEDFSNAAWVKSNVAVDSDSNAMPDGSAGTVNELRATAANATIVQDLGVIASAAKTLSIWLKRKTGTGDIDLTLDGGASWQAVSVNSSWKRFDVTQTLADPDVGIRIVTSDDEVLAWGAQLEDAATFPTSYVPTGASSVARAADSLAYDNTGDVLIDVASPFTVICAASPMFDGADLPASGPEQFPMVWGIRHAVGGTNGFNLQAERTSDGYGFAAWENGASSSASSTTDCARGVTNILATTWDPSDESLQLFVDGALEGSSPGANTPASLPGALQIGANGVDANDGFFNVAHVMIYDRMLTPSEIRGLSDTIRNWV